MVQQRKEKSAQPKETSRRQERAHRILDAAEALILRWGYNKTTLDDIARQAGVAKGTLYLHWKTREDLFHALVSREKLKMAEDLRQRITTDPEGATLHGLTKHSALAMMKNPLMKAILLGDMEILGKLAGTEHRSAASLERLEGFKVYLELLREYGLTRSDLDLQTQLYVYSAIFMGFFLVAPFMAEEYVPADDELAELIADAIQHTLEPGRTASPDELQTVSRAFIHFFDHAVTTAQKQFQQELES